MAGKKLQAAFVGRPEQLKDTVLLDPLIGATVIVAHQLVSVAIVTAARVVGTKKSGGMV
ncbi:MAG: hypothetical protein WAN35_03950 [Terracidiphilus sp.]|jgi:hypothetical protein